MYTVLFVSESPRPNLCSKLALFNIIDVESAAMLIFKLSVNEYGLGLSYELLFIILAQRAAKL